MHISCLVTGEWTKPHQGFLRESVVVGSTFTDARDIFRLTRLLECRYLLIITFVRCPQIIRSRDVNTFHRQIDLRETEIRRTGLTLDVMEVVEQKSLMTVRKIWWNSMRNILKPGRTP